VRYRVRGWLQITLLRVRHRLSYVIALAGLVLSVALALAQPPWGAAGWLLVASLVSFAVGPVTFAIDSWSLWQEGRRSVLSVVEPGPRVDAMRLGDACHDYERASFHGQRYAFDERVDDRLVRSQVPLKVLPGRFGMPEVIAEHAPVVLAAKFREGRAIYNSRVARLATDLSVAALDGGAAVDVQEADYFAGECTNEMIGLELHRRDRRGRTRTEFVGIEMLGDAGIISDIADSDCANIVGISTLAFTRDRKLVVVTQSGRSAQSANQLAPSGSGSADPVDYADVVATLQEFVARAMTRELVEECSLDDRSVRTRPLGFARVLTRGGKPEFFGVSAIDADFATVVISRRERTYVSAIDPTRVKLRSAADLVAALDAYREKCGHRFSLALEINLAVLRRYAQRHWTDLHAFLEGGESIATKT
jgi:hypothetical protein